MDETTAITVMSALAQPTRFRVALALAREFPRGLAVNDLARLVEIPQNTMSSHLAILSRAGIVVANRLGRVVEYSAHEDTLSRLADFLTTVGPRKAGSTRPR